MAITALERAWDTWRPDRYGALSDGYIRITDACVDEMLTAFDFGKAVAGRMNALFSIKPLADRYHIHRRTVDSYTRGARSAGARMRCRVFTRAKPDRPRVRVVLYLARPTAVWLSEQGVNRDLIVEQAILQSRIYRQQHDLLEQD